MFILQLFRDLYRIIFYFSIFFVFRSIFGFFMHLLLLQMKKVSSHSSQKYGQSKNLTKSISQIKFNLEAQNLACFKGKQKIQSNKSKPDPSKQIKFLSQFAPVTIARTGTVDLPTERSRTLSCTNTFNETVVIMQYDNIDVYIDNSTRKKSNSKESNSSQNTKKSQPEEGVQDQFVKVCLQVITEQTDNTSNALSVSNQHSTPQNLTPRSSQFNEYYENYEFFCEPKGKIMRNRQSVSFQESKRFIIQYQNIELDGRTTVMVKNIPNKYTQEILLQQFTINFKNKFDFFYLPIDKDNDCNVGYAFVNFINTSYLKDFYQQFHNQKWKRYKSPKICNICYARYQGTLQLADHFKHTKIINQKDRKVKPLIGLTEASKIKDIKQIIKNQRNQQ